ncbi:MAG: amino acid adenylation domain-containing protein [Bacteroidota bacterium]
MMRLTLPQRDVYFEQLLYPNDPIYNIGARVAVKGVLDRDVLNLAYIALIDQHDAYRSIVIVDEDEVQIKFLAQHRTELGFIDFSKGEHPDEQANAYMQKTFVKPFNLNAEKLLHQFTLVKVSDSFHYIFSMYHHIITDGWGTSLMFQRWVKNYNELMAHGKIETEYPFSYEAFVANDEEYQNSDDFITDKAYWKQRFQTLPKPLFNPQDGGKQLNQSRRKVLQVKRATYNQIEGVAKEFRCSTFHVILASLYLYFGRRSYNNDFAIGLPVLNRGKSIFKKTVGLFMGVSALRMAFDFEDTFEDLVASVKQQLRQDYRHQRFPIGKLIQELGAFRDKDHLFNLTLSYEKQDYAAHFGETETRVIPMTHQAERVALALYIREFDALEDVIIDFDYNLNYFNESSIDQVVQHFEQLISEIIKNPREQLKSYQYLTPSEEELVRISYNQTQFDYPKDATFLQFFAEQVKIRSDKIAITNEFISYTYQELDTISNSVANYIALHKSVEEVIPMAVLMERSPQLVAVFLGILKSGCSYIPLDPNFPKERLEFIIKHSEVGSIIVDGERELSVPKDVVSISFEEIISSEAHDVYQNDKVIAADTTAYIIYTSGSTGEPKGVVIPHGALLNFLLSMQKEPKITEQDLLFSVTTQSFDISMLEFFVPLISGATLYIPSEQVLSDPSSLIDALKKVSPTIIQATPSFYQLLFNANWKGDSSLRILCGGDLLSKSLAQKLLDSCHSVWNMYGPTETTIWSSCKLLKSSKDASCIGKPIGNTKMYVLDPFFKLLPPNFIGDIYIGGTGLAKGYLKNEALTDEKFIESPFQDGEKIYHTGDLGKWNSKGELEFLGRSDNQVKIRGYRIELGEIEVHLDELDGIKASVVVAKKSSRQESYLVAYVLAETSSFDAEALRRALVKKLPEYMIPNVIIPLDSFPLTPNNKVDRNKLAQRKISRGKKEPSHGATMTPVETRLSTLYAKVLELENKPERNNNFFALGGHSLNAVRLLNLIEGEFQFRAPLKAIFDYPEIKSLAQFLETRFPQTERPITEVEIRPSYPVTPAQYAIWLAGQGHKKSIAYNMSAAYHINGNIDVALLEDVFQSLIHYYEILRTNFVEFQGFPHQKINSIEETSFSIDRIDVEGSTMEETIQKYIHKEFDLVHDALLRVGIIHDSQHQSCLVFSTHHLIMDGWSLEQLIKKVIAYYMASISKIEMSKVRLPFQFKDYASWLYDFQKESEVSNSEFWNDYLDRYAWTPLIPFDIENDRSDEHGALFHFQWDAALVEKVKILATVNNCSLHTLLVTALKVLICKMYGHNDICIGTVNSGRSFPESDEQLGMFVKTLPLRTKLKLNQNFNVLLKGIHENLLAIDAHQDLPEGTVRSLRLDLLLVLQNPSFNYQSIDLGNDLKLTALPDAVAYSRLPLLLNFIEMEGELSGSAHFDTDKYSLELMEVIIQKYEKLLQFICEEPDAPLEDIDINLAFENEKTIDIDFNF